MTIKILHLKYALILVSLLFLLSLLGPGSYKGSLFYYVVFDITWLAVFLSACCFSQTYVILYTQSMLFLGFWVKLIAYLVLGAFFVEPTGYWILSEASPDAWDRVLLISSLAGCGVLFANLLWRFGTKKDSPCEDECTIPQWYVQHSHVIWSVLVFLGVVTSVINSFYHFLVTGLRPEIILPFHLNALITFLMVIVIPLGMAACLGWERDLKQKQKYFHWICFIAFITSISILSRGICVFWTVPYILIFISDPDFSFKKLYFWKNKKTVIIYLVFSILSLVLVSVIRTHYYAVALNDVGYESSSKNLVKEESATQLKKLLVGRWVGLEAVMATTAFPEGGWSFFWKHALDKPSVGDVGIYTRDILKVNNYHNTKETMFSSLPGLTGILNYAHSNGLVFGGMFGVCFLLCWLEKIVFFMMRNKFLLSQQGFIWSYWCIAGLNIPYLGMINLFECLFVSVSLALINVSYDWANKYFNKSSSAYGM